jgi:hypothetical protein
MEQSVLLILALERRYRYALSEAPEAIILTGLIGHGMHPL